MTTTTTLQDLQKNLGATFDSETHSIPVSFGNDAEALAAAKNEVVLCDRSHWGLLRLSGEEQLQFLHNQSTNDFNSLQPGQSQDTVFTNSTARTIDLATAYATEDAILLLVSPNRRETMMKWLDRYIFPFDKVELEDVSDRYSIFSLIGPQSDTVWEKLGISLDLSANSHQLVTLNQTQVRVATGSGLAMPGYTLLVNREEAATVWKLLTETAGVPPMGDSCWEKLRILQGRPAAEAELTEDYNPLEAALWHNISFEKGCYIGQETIARLNTYKGVKMQLWGVRLPSFVEPGTTVMLNGKKVGTLTSCTETSDGVFGLAYIRTKAGGLGLQVSIGDVEAEVVDLDFASRGYLEAENLATEN